MVIAILRKPAQDFLGYSIRLSLMYVTNNNGPKTDPCGTPLSTSLQLEYCPLITTVFFLQTSESFCYIFIAFHCSSFHTYRWFYAGKYNSTDNYWWLCYMLARDELTL